MWKHLNANNLENQKKLRKKNFIIPSPQITINMLVCAYKIFIPTHLYTHIYILYENSIIIL